MSLTDIFTLADEYVSAVVELDPISATSLGMVSSELTDFSPRGAQAKLALIDETLLKLQKLSPANEDDRIAALVLDERLNADRDSIIARDYEADLNILACPVQSIRMVFDIMPLDTDDDKSVWTKRVQAIPASLLSWQESLSAGLASGNVESRRQAQEVSEQCREYANKTYFTPAALDISDEAVLAAAVAEEAFLQVAQFLADTYLPKARAQDGVGLERYVRSSRKWNGCDIDAQELFDWGWKELDRITERMETVTRQLHPTATIAEIRDILNTDPRYVIHGEKQIVEFLEKLTADTTAEMANKHFDIPDSIRKCDVKLAGAGSAAAPYYMSPSEDLKRPGSTWLPTLGSAEFHTWHLVSTWYHEAVPGHHLQVASTVIHREKLSRFQRTFGWTSGYGEGWALYAERLMDELGYFKDPGYEMGFLCAQALRAARIVVDIGMHCGWSVPADQKWETAG
ncbi:MAG: hypothetical protein RLZZ426_1112, partial [Actinomycetota bacterium]